MSLKELAEKREKKAMFTYVYSYHAALVFVDLFVDLYFAIMTCTITVCNPCTVSGSGYVIRYYVSGRKVSIWW